MTNNSPYNEATISKDGSQEKALDRTRLSDSVHTDINRIISSNPHSEALYSILEKLWLRIQEIKTETEDLLINKEISGGFIRSFEDILIKINHIARDLFDTSKYSAEKDFLEYVGNFGIFEELCCASIYSYSDSDSGMGCRERFNLNYRLSKDDNSPEERIEARRKYDILLEKFGQKKDLNREIIIMMKWIVDTIDEMKKEEIVKPDLILNAIDPETK